MVKLNFIAEYAMFVQNIDFMELKKYPTTFNFSDFCLVF